MIKEIIEREWQFFDKVLNIDGRALCQDDFDTFSKQRTSQFLVFDQITLKSYLNDLKQYKRIGLNPLTLKYAYMMSSSQPEYFLKIKEELPEIDDMTAELIDLIVGFEVAMREEFNDQYPHLASLSRSTHSSHDQEDDISFETYLRGELMTYSPKTLYHYGQMLVCMINNQLNMITLIQENTVKAYGYKTLEDAEKEFH